MLPAALAWSREESNQVSNATCKITGIDINEAMLNAARKIPDIDWHLGSATALPFADGSFEVVFCQQGLQYFPDRAAAMREMSRVLTPGGRLSLNVWGPLDRQPFDIVYSGLRSRFFRARRPDSLQPRLFPEHRRRASEACHGCLSA